MSSVPILHTERLTLRALCVADFGPLVAFYASDRSQFVGGPATAEESWRMLACEIGHWTLRGYGRWAVEETATGQLAGVVGPWFPHGWPEPEIGWDLMNGFEGRGYASEAARAALDHAWSVLGWDTAISMVKPDNAGSRRLAQRLGCTFDGNFEHERWGDMEIWRHAGPQVTS